MRKVILVVLIVLFSSSLVYSSTGEKIIKGCGKVTLFSETDDKRVDITILDGSTEEIDNWPSLILHYKEGRLDRISAPHFIGKGSLDLLYWETFKAGSKTITRKFEVNDNTSTVIRIYIDNVETDNPRFFFDDTYYINLAEPVLAQHLKLYKQVRFPLSLFKNGYFNIMLATLVIIVIIEIQRDRKAAENLKRNIPIQDITPG